MPVNDPFQATAAGSAGGWLLELMYIKGGRAAAVRPPAAWNRLWLNHTLGFIPGSQGSSTTPPAACDGTATAL
jgi:hypothetical protein